MNNNDLTTADVLADKTKDFCSIYQSTPQNEDDDDIDMKVELLTFKSTFFTKASLH